jgi:hypothetical protein
MIDLGATPPKTLQDLLDREAIRDLAYRYATLVGCGAPMQAAALFAADGELITGNGHGVGRAEIEKYMATVAPGTSIPLISNHLIALNGDEATGSCAMHTPWLDRQPPGLVGYYDDAYRRVDGVWLFSFRRYKVIQKGS